MAVWPDQSPQWINVDRAPDLEARDCVQAVFNRFDKLDPLQIGAEVDRSDAIPFMQFDKDAAGLFIDWYGKLQRRIRKQDEGQAVLSSSIQVCQAGAGAGAHRFPCRR